MHSTKITKAGFIFDEYKIDMHVGSNETYLDIAGFAHLTWVCFRLPEVG